MTEAVITHVSRYTYKMFYNVLQKGLKILPLQNFVKLVYAYTMIYKKVLFMKYRPSVSVKQKWAIMQEMKCSFRNECHLKILLHVSVLEG